MLHQHLVADSLKHSEREIPRMLSRNGVTDVIIIRAGERVGNMFMLLCAIHTKDGCEIVRKGLHAKNISLTAFKD